MLDYKLEKFGGRYIRKFDPRILLNRITDVVMCFMDDGLNENEMLENISEKIGRIWEDVTV